MTNIPSTRIFYPSQVFIDERLLLDSTSEPIAMIVQSSMCLVQLPTVDRPATFVDIEAVVNIGIVD